MQLNNLIGKRTITMRIILLTLFFLTSSKSLFAQNSSPVIEMLKVQQKEQGEEGIVQTLVRGRAVDKEDGNRLDYDYKIVSGHARIENIKNYAILYTEKPGEVVVQLKVTDRDGAFSLKEIKHRVQLIKEELLYDDRETWNAVVGKKSLRHPSFQFCVEDTSLPNILLIGNSISIGYTSYVRNELKGKCNVYRIPTNGGDTKSGVHNLKFWLNSKEWDVVHFNFGLHDLKRIVAINLALI